VIIKTKIRDIFFSKMNKIKEKEIIRLYPRRIGTYQRRIKMYQRHIVAYPRRIRKYRDLSETESAGQSE
jgi:hypothetical protein